MLGKDKTFRLWMSDAPDGGYYLAGFNLAGESAELPFDAD